MIYIDPEIGWFEMAEVPVIDQYLARISQIFKKAWLSRYPRPREVIFDNGYGFNINFIPLLKDFYVKLTCKTIKNPQSNAILERIHQVVRSMLNTKDISNVMC